MSTEQFRVTAEYLKEQGLSPSFPRRFFSNIKITESCWFWMLGCDHHGYGKISKGARVNGSIHASRASWILHFGPIPFGKDVLHDCPGGDNPRCVNPAHLKLGDDRDNIYDAIRKNRWRFGENTRASRITAYIASEIIRIHESGEMSLSQMSRQFKVSLSQVSRIANGKSWRHLRIPEWCDAKLPNHNPVLRDIQ